MRPYYEDATAVVHAGDCLDVLRELPDNSVDAVVTDPPAGIHFMGREWDHHKGGREQWVAWLADVMGEALRVTKPGGHAFVWALPRTSHWTACGLEDAGWEIRDRVVHLFGTGFPKSLDVSKAIDKAMRGVPQGGVNPTSPNHGKYRTTTTEGKRWDGDSGQGYGAGGSRFLADGAVSGSDTGRAASGVAATASDAARWQGWGTALKPAAEDWWLARKPLGGTVAANVTTWGTGALNVDGCRTTPGEGKDRTGEASRASVYEGIGGDQKFTMKPGVRGGSAAGRWPANVVLDESQAEALDRQSGESVTPSAVTRGASLSGKEGATARSGGAMERRENVPCHGDVGGASRFFYVAKADSSERVRVNGTAHPTVKPLALMRWLVRLVTPPGGTVLEPFAGSGTTVEAAILEGFRCIAIEREPDYLPLIVQRINRRRDPVAAVKATEDDGGLFDFLGSEASA